MVCHLFKHAGICVTHCIVIKSLFCPLTNTVTKPFYRFAFGSLTALHLEFIVLGGTHELKTFGHPAILLHKTLSSEGRELAGE